MKKTIALILAVLMLVPCFLTAAFAWAPTTEEDDFGIAPGYVRTKEVRKNADGSSWAMASAYNKAGQLTKTVKVEKSSYGTTKTTTAYAYDKNGNITKKVVKFAGEDSSYKETYAYSYNKSGDVKKAVYRYEGSGNYWEKMTTAYTYDWSGNLTKVTVKRSGLGGEWSQTQTFTYDRFGRKIRENTHNGFSRIEETVREFAYDSDDNLIRINYAEYSADGTYEYHSTQTNTYDKNGNITKSTFRDTDSSNELVTRYTYDKNGRLKKTVETLSAQGYGDSYTETTTYTYDANGNLIKEVTARENAFMIRKTATAYSYDVRGNLIKKVVAKTDTDSHKVEKDVYAYAYQKIAA